MTYEISMPRFESLALKDLISTANNILEYGAGGSTVYAYKNNKTVTTVETDKDYLDNLLEYCDNAELIKPIYVDVGNTTDWGYSLQLPKGFNTIRQYIRIPWDTDTFDLVIVDGRFRAATFMYSWNRAEPGTTFFWDDFSNRPYYHEILQHLVPEAYVGRAAIFVKENNWFEFGDETIHKYVSDQR